MVLVDRKHIGSDVWNIRCGATGVRLIQDGHRTVKRIMKIFKSTGRNRMKYLLAVLVSFVILDGVVTEWLVSGGQAREANPILELCKYVIFPELKGKTFLIERPEKFGGNLEFSTYGDLEKAFESDLHPLDLKNATADYVNKILEPVHKYFEKQSDNYRKSAGKCNIK